MAGGQGPGKWADWGALFVAEPVEGDRSFPAGAIPAPRCIWGLGERRLTSAVHVVRYNIREQPSGPPMVELHLALNRRKPEKVSIIETPVLRMIVVTDSGGHREARPVIDALIKLGPLVKRVPLTVTNRENMLFRVLLGRKALEGDFIVDVGRKYQMRKK